MNQTNIKKITILIVSYYSSKHLVRILNNLIEKAELPEQLQFLIVDNTNGLDPELKNLFIERNDLRILLNDGSKKQRSISHSNALDLGLSHCNSEFTLIIDPDVYIFKKKWDTLCLKLCNKKRPTIVGAPYPKWKIGKVHDYPSVVFMFFKTKELQKLDLSFYPFPELILRIKNSILRKIIRLGFLGSKRSLNQNLRLRSLTSWLEKLTGITSPDTGDQFIKGLRSTGAQAICFEAKYNKDILINNSKALSELSKEFEIFIFDNELMMTHMYGSGVFYWKTEKGADIKYWKKLITNIEKNGYGILK